MNIPTPSVNLSANILSALLGFERLHFHEAVSPHDYGFYLLGVVSPPSSAPFWRGGFVTYPDVPPKTP